MNRFIRFLSLLILTIVLQSCTEISKSNYPEFSWEKVPLYMHMRKSTAFSAEELEYLASFPIVTLEKITGSKTYGSSEKGSLEAAKAIKGVSPDTKVLYYRNVMCNYGTYEVNTGLDTIPGAFLVDSSNGNMMLHRNVREVYDLSNPILRKWWVDHCVEMSAYPEIDGIFLDGNIKALEPVFLGKEVGLEKKQEVADGYEMMMKDMRNRIGSNELMVANLIRARLPDAGLHYMDYMDGSYLEGIEGAANGIPPLEYLAKGIDAVQKAAREGKIICLSMGLGRSAMSRDRIDDSRRKVEWGPEVMDRLDYCLAMFLICAEKYSYFLAHDGYAVDGTSSSVWLKRFPQYDKPLGPPKGPAEMNGYTYTREFEHCSVFLDIENKIGKIDWE
ncbi:putative glycoside hydrolase [Bacteroidota bacterium]